MTDYYDLFGMVGKFETRPGAIIQDGPFTASCSGKAMIDGGDTTFHAGHYITGIALMYGKEALDKPLPFYPARITMSKLYHGNGLYRRHPDSKMWYSDAHRVGRDQQKAVVSAEAYIKGSWKRMIPFMLRHLFFRGMILESKTRDNGNNHFKFPTITFITIWASYIRYFMVKSKWFKAFYPLLLILDLEIFINGKIKASSEKADSDVLNHINYSIWFHKVAPTLWTHYNLKHMDKENFKKRLYEYYDDGRCPVFVAELWADLMDKHINKTVANE